MLGGTLRWTSSPSSGSGYTLSQLQKNELRQAPSGVAVVVYVGARDGLNFSELKIDK